MLVVALAPVGPVGLANLMFIKKQNKTKQNKTKQNKTKQNKIFIFYVYYITKNLYVYLKYLSLLLF
jgi:hypothetical protein